METFNWVREKALALIINYKDFSTLLGISFVEKKKIKGNDGLLKIKFH